MSTGNLDRTSVLRNSFAWPLSALVDRRVDLTPNRPPCAHVQLLVPYGLGIGCPHMGLLWGDTSDVLHAVGEGEGCRISIVLCNHEWAETGVRPDDGKRVVS